MQQPTVGRDKRQPVPSIKELDAIRSDLLSLRHKYAPFDTEDPFCHPLQSLLSKQSASTSNEQQYL